MSKVIARIAFIPSLIWDLVCQRLRGQHWWDSIEKDLFLGGFPRRSTVKRLHAMGVRAVVNTCEEMEGPTKEYAEYGIDQLHIPTVDFTEPSLGDIKLAIGFINRNRGKLGSVYVHCKSGRGRSSTVILCWLMQFHNVSPEAAQQRLQERRGQVLKRLFKRESVKQYWLEIREMSC